MINNLSSYILNHQSANSILNKTLSKQINSKEVKNSNLVSDKNEAVSQVLGYGVDKEGFFTSDFNEKASIPKDYKIYAQSMQNIANSLSDKENYLRIFNEVDIAKTLANAYKILSQVVGEDVLNSKESFTYEDIKNFPQAYEFNRQIMQVTQLHQTQADYENANFDFQNKNSMIIYNTFYSKENIFINAQDDNEGFAYSINSHVSKYIDKDGGISKGGLLVALIKSNSYIVEGQSTANGKAQGFDKNMNDYDVEAFIARGGDGSTMFLGGSSISLRSLDDKNEIKEFETQKPIALIELFDKEFKKLLENIQKQAKRKRLDMKV